ncbi:MAG: hypothetical protein ACI83W_001378 [Marinoscillum sp.]|jgi:hypothetical protein
MKLKTLLVATSLLILANLAKAQYIKEDSVIKKHFIGSTLLMAFTPLLDPSPRYFQLNYGYAITAKDVISIEAITWAYQAPLGIPLGAELEDKANNFPGSVRAFSGGIAYKRFLWKGLYGQIHSTALRQNYLDEKDERIQSGFQLFNVLRFGYHIDLFNNRWYLEPSLAFISWPINTNFPATFQVE